MDIKAVGFDIGGTLVDYNKPLNWSGSFKDALKYMCNNTKILLTEERQEQAISILQKYNTRINPREKEVTSDQIFGEIFEKWGEEKSKIFTAKKEFYTFFQREVTTYPDAKKALKYCNDNNIKVSVYTDVAYGMDDEFSLKDIEEISEYIDLKLTSRNVGYRKPNSKGFELMLKTFKCKPEEMLYIGDEEKDVLGARKVGIHTVLINRNNQVKEYGQEFTINSLEDIITLIQK